MRRVSLIILTSIVVSLTAIISVHAADDIAVQLQIPIGAQESITVCTSDDTSLSCNGLAEYIIAIYRWVIGIAAVLAVLALTWSGVQWMTSGGDSGKIQEARKVMINAIIGLLLALGSYTMLFAINPDLVQFEPLTVKRIAAIDLDMDEFEAPRATNLHKPTGSTPPGGSTSPGGPTPPEGNVSGFPNLKLISIPTARTPSTDDINKYGKTLADIRLRTKDYRFFGKNFLFDAHENIHTINSEINGGTIDHIEYTKGGISIFHREDNILQGLYLGEGKAINVLVPSDIYRRQITNNLPKIFQNTKFNDSFSYLKDYPEYDNPLMLLDEFSAYNQEGKAVVELAKLGYYDENGLSKSPQKERFNHIWRQVGFIPIGLAVGLTIEKTNPDYFVEEKQFKDALRYLIEDAVTLYRIKPAELPENVQKLEKKLLPACEKIFVAMQTGTDKKTQALRNLARRWYGAAWTQKWLGF